MSDPELTAMQAAYEHIKGMSRAQWTRALKYISKRMAEDDRAAHVRVETDAPTAWIAAENWDERWDDKEELAGDLAQSGEILEVNGVAVVSQQFVIAIPVCGGPENDIDGYEHEWFDTREAAEKYLASMKEEGTDVQQAPPSPL